MASTRLDPGQLIARYLAGELTASESAAFEDAVALRPDLRAEIERTLKLKEGLARLGERGQLHDLLDRAPPGRRWLGYAAAAAAAMVAFGIVMLMAQRRPAVIALAASPAAFSTSGQVPPVLKSFLLARTRGAAAVHEMSASQVPGLIRLRIQPADFQPESRYRAQVSRLAGADASSAAVMGRIDSVVAAPDGYVDLFLNSRQFPPADYAIILTPTGRTVAVAQPETFLIQVR